jgi:hypothetical protein
VEAPPQNRIVFMDIGYPPAVNCFLFEMGGVTMGQTSRIVTIVDGVEVMEVTVHDPEGNPVETSYHVRGEKYETLKQAMKAARAISEQ